MGALFTIIPMLLQFLGPALAKVIPDAGQRAQVQADFQKAVLENQAALNNAMADVMKADAGSESWMARNARPVVVFWSIGLITWLGVLAPMAGLQREAIQALAGVPSELWNLTSVGIGAFMLARTVDKVAPAFAKK
ncbi:3TM-type holin [uncultured Methylobacterium sp.]|uniref:3TM-type holin n=1 Tax=uncultured Methylobacterium sp. TaxID=157278 RepID=UPI0035CACAF3